jgi:hypothetical protein
MYYHLQTFKTNKLLSYLSPITDWEFKEVSDMAKIIQIKTILTKLILNFNLKK